MNLSELEPILLECSRKLNAPIYFVGGTLRDAYLKLPAHDVDIALKGAKQAARYLSRRLQGRCVVLDAERSIFRLILLNSNEPIAARTLDIAELRRPTIRQDLAERDFTVNAMAREVGKSDWLDPFGGKRDLKKKCLRALKANVFQEDPLRLVRAFRISAQFHLTMEPKTRGWISKDRKMLSRVAPERVREEFLRFVDCPSMSGSLEHMDSIGLLTQIFPELEAGRLVAKSYYGKGGVVRHSLDTVSNFEWLMDHLAKPSKLFDQKIIEQIWPYLNELQGGFRRHAFLKLGALLHDVGKPATAQHLNGRLRFFAHEEVGAKLVGPRFRSLRFSRQEDKTMTGWVRHHMRLGNLAAAAQITDKAVVRFWRDLEQDGIGMILLSLADHYDYLSKRLWMKATDPVEKMAKRLLEKYLYERSQVTPQKLVNGHDLMKAFRLKPSPIIGKLLQVIEEAQIEKKVATAAEAIAFAKKKLPTLLKLKNNTSF